MSDSAPFGVRIAGTGSAVPERVVTNFDLARELDTSHDWIIQRTGIVQRHRFTDPGDHTVELSCQALSRALQAADMKPDDLDLLMVGCCTQEMSIPSTSCRVAGKMGIRNAGAFDLVAGCSGFVYALNVGDTMVRSGRYRAVAVVGCDVLTNIIDTTERTVSILFGDAAGAVLLVPDPDPSRGCLYQTMSADGTSWQTLYQPMRSDQVLDWDRDNPIRLGCLRMQGREVYKFAVNKFREVIEDALVATGLSVDDVAQFVCHQSNARIIESAKEKIGLPDDKVLINIDRYGNTSAGSVALCFDELVRAGKLKAGDIAILVAFGAGLTWASSVWRL